MKARHALRLGVLAVGLAAPLAGQWALSTGEGAAWALPLAAVQAVAVGFAAGAALPRALRWVAFALPAAMLGVTLVAALASAEAGLKVAAGAVHAVSYTGLLLLFGATLLPGRVPMVTRFARRMNPRWHEDQAGYTRGVTWAWVGLFAAQLLASAALARWAPGAWPWFVNFGHGVAGVALGLAEYAWRRHRLGDRGSDWREMLAGFRAARTGAPAASAAAPATRRAGGDA
jgi:uncharacterized membrane protein